VRNVKDNWLLALFISTLLIISIGIVASIYLIPVNDPVNRQLLFGIVFQMWGIMTTVIIVRKVLQMRDYQRWKAINSHVFNFLYLGTWAVMGQILGVFQVKIEVKESKMIEKFGVEYLNPKAEKEWSEKVKKEFEKTVKDGKDIVEKNMLKWKPTTHKEFARILKEYKDIINRLLESYPHQIPPEFLSLIIDVRERAHGLSNQSTMLSDTAFFVEQNVDYQGFHDRQVTDMESDHVLDLFCKLLKLLEVLDKAVGPEWKHHG
jgi:hypothetical protein